MKKIIRLSLVISILVVSSMSIYAQANHPYSSYMGQTPPGSIPQIFAPGIISLDNRFETYPTFSPDGKEMFFSVVNASWTTGKIFCTQERNGNWTTPQVADFSNNNYYNLESFITPDGNKQFFTSNRPPSLNTDIWMIERASDTTWTNPVRLSSPVNSNTVDGSACVTNNGTLYLKSLRGGGIGGSILYRSRLIDTVYSQVENLGNIIHTVSGESEPFMAPDESYLIFISESRSGGYEGWDLWICFNNNDSTWSAPINMGPNINTTNDEYGPRVTLDGQYLFFTRENRGNTMDIYWVSASIIDSLKQVVTEIKDIKNQIPESIRIYQNYPNPFNPTTKISWQSSVSGWQTLKVYDVLGKEVATLVDEFKPAGSYESEFDAINISSGIYFYVFKTNNFFDQKKMIVLK